MIAKCQMLKTNHSPTSTITTTTTKRISPKCAHRLLFVFIVLQISIGIALLLVGQYYKLLLNQYLPAAYQSEIYQKLWLVQLHGVHIIASYGCGVPLTRRLHANTQNVATLLNVWNISILVVSLDGVLMHWMWQVTRSHLERTVEHAWREGLRSYYADAEWRLLWDGFQYNDQCCGVVGFGDWQSWLSVAESAMQDYVLSDGDAFISLTPYSCCKSNAKCYNGDFMAKRSTNVWMRIPSVNLTAINQGGCMQAFKHRLSIVQMALGAMAVMVFVLQIVIFMIMRFLFVLNRFSKLTTTSDRHSQTDIAAGKPIDASYFTTTTAAADAVCRASSLSSTSSTLNSVESIQLVYECEKDMTDGCVAIDDMILQRKQHKQYTKLRDKRKQRVRYSDLLKDGENDGAVMTRMPLLKRS